MTTPAAWTLELRAIDSATTTAATPAAPSKRPGGTSPATRPARTGVRLARVGTLRPAALCHRAARRSQPPLRSSSSRADPRSARRPGCSPSRSSTSARQVTCGGEQGLLRLAFAPDYARSGRFYVDYTDRRATPGSSSTARGAPTAPTLAQPADGARDGQPEANHNGGPCCSAPTACSTSASATAAAAATGTASAATARTSVRCSASCCASTRARRRPALHGAALQPVRRPAGRPARSAPTGCATRGASPSTAQRRPRDRRRRPGRRSRRSTSRPRSTARGRELRLAGVRGQAPLQPGESAPGAVGPGARLHHDGGRCSITGGYVVRDRGCRRSTAATSTATSATGGC